MRVIIAVGIVACAIAQAHAANTDDVLHEAVNISDLRQDTPEGLATLYHRLHAAAERVCSPLASVDKFNLHEKKCIREAVDRATEQVPALAHYDGHRRRVRHG